LKKKGLQAKLDKDCACNGEKLFTIGLIALVFNMLRKKKKM